MKEKCGYCSKEIAENCGVKITVNREDQSSTWFCDSVCFSNAIKRNIKKIKFTTKKERYAYVSKQKREYLAAIRENILRKEIITKKEASDLFQTLSTKEKHVCLLIGFSYVYAHENFNPMKMIERLHRK